MDRRNEGMNKLEIIIEERSSRHANDANIQ